MGPALRALAQEPCRAPQPDAGPSYSVLPVDAAGQPTCVAALTVLPPLLLPPGVQPGGPRGGAQGRRGCRGGWPAGAGVRRGGLTAPRWRAGVCGCTPRGPGSGAGVHARIRVQGRVDRAALTGGGQGKPVYGAMLPELRPTKPGAALPPTTAALTPHPRPLGSPRRRRRATCCRAASPHLQRGRSGRGAPARSSCTSGMVRAALRQGRRPSYWLLTPAA